MAALSVSPPTVETIVLVRHAEKPEAGLGQLDCQGLNRALALPAVLAARYGRPAAIFAPDPAVAKQDGGRSYDYVRPLATVEPTAIAFGLPVDVSIGFADLKRLEQRLDEPSLATATVLVAWEHSLLVSLARQIATDHGGQAIGVPDWNKADFDGIYVLRITRNGGQATTRFSHEAEGLNGQPTACPK